MVVTYSRQHTVTRQNIASIAATIRGHDRFDENAACDTCWMYAVVDRMFNHVSCKSYAERIANLQTEAPCVIPNVWNKSMWETRPSKYTGSNRREPSDRHSASMETILLIDADIAVV
jgi:hypothetical protein